ncbi:MAG: 1-acyl-sn-glycerol-3-phosphate acyltransferase [Clostridia bacterium]|nr:1-acyl-sn-glycerol-3-phosphate acyltransferase [Clostridia bacterium]
MKNTKKDSSWIKPRHAVVRNVAYWVLYPFVRIRYGITIKKFTEQKNTPYLVLLNHQTPFDQFFVGMSFRGPVYYLATEDIFSKGFISKVIKWLVAPIPIKKQSTDVRAVINCIRVAKEGGTIAIAPEGNRTYSGKTEYISPTIVPLARKLKLPIALYRIEGGYGAEPRWSDCVRRGKMSAGVFKVLEPEDYVNLTDEEFLEEIKQGIFVSEAKADQEFLSSKRAEYLERAVYVCPHCKGFSKFESKGNEIKCKNCGLTIEYGKDKRLKSNNKEFPFEFVNDWYEFQKKFVNSVDTRTLTSKPIYVDCADVLQVIVYKNKEILLKQAEIRLYGDRIAINENTSQQMIFPFDKVSAVAILGRNKVNVYFDSKVYQFKGDKRFNAIKYAHLCYRHKNILEDNNGEFLGL